MLCQTIPNAGRRNPHCSLHHLLEDAGKQGGDGGVELERTWAQEIWEVNGCAGDITLAAKARVILIDVLTPKQALDVGALAAPVRQLRFGRG